VLKTTNQVIQFPNTSEVPATVTLRLYYYTHYGSFFQDLFYVVIL